MALDYNALREKHKKRDEENWKKEKASQKTTSPSVTNSGSGDIYKAGAQRRQTNIDSRSLEAQKIKESADEKARAFVLANRGKETAYLGTTNYNYVVTTRGEEQPVSAQNNKQTVDIASLNAARQKATKENKINAITQVSGSKSQMPGDARSQNTGAHVATDKNNSKLEQIAELNKNIANDEYFKSDIDRKMAIDNSTQRISTDYTEKYNNMSADSKALLSFINREDEAKTNINWMSIAAAFSGQTGSNAAAAGQYAASLTASQEARKMLRELYGMTDDEIDAAVILHERSRNAEIAQKQDAEMRSFEKEHPVIASAVSVPMSVAGGVAAPFGTLESVQDVVNAKALGMGEIGLDANNMYRALGSASKSIRDEFTATHDLMIGDYDVGDMLYNTAMSGADSLLAGTVGGKFGGVILGAGTAADTAQELSSRGISTEKAIAGGLAAGIFEGLFESVSIGNLKAFKTADIKTVKDAVKNVAKSMAVNASEETLTEIANITYDTLANGGLSEYELKVAEYSKTMTKEEAEKKARNELAWRAAEAGMSGAIMGFGFGTGGVASNYAGQTASFAATGATAKENGMTGAIISAGQAAPEGSKSRGLADKLAEKQKDKGKVNSYKLGQLAETNAKYVEKNGEDSETGKNMRDAFNQKLYKELAEVDRAEATNPKIMTELGEATIDGGNFDSETQQLGEFKGIFKDKDGDNAVKTTDGIEFKVSDAVEKLNNKTVARLYEKTKDMSAGAANLFIDNYDGESIDEYKRAFDYYYRMGRTGMSVSDIRKNDNLFGNYLTAEAQARIANAGLQDREFRKGFTDLSVGRKTDRYRFETKVLQAVGEKRNLEIFVIDEDSNINGTYLAGTNRIVIRRNAEGKLLLRTASHEAFHFIKNQATDDAGRTEVKALEDFVIDALKNNGTDIDAEIARLGAITDGDGNTVYATREDCIEEIVANSMFDAFTNEKFARKLMNENRSLFGKVANRIKEILADIKAAISMLGNSDATIRALKDDVESLEKINTMFDSLLEKAGEKYKAEHESGQKNNADQTALKYSLNSNARVELHKALYDMNYRNEVLLRDNTPQIMLDQRGVKNLPMVMKASHIRENVFTEEEARKLGLKVNKGSHYHGIGEEQFLAIVDGLDNVSEAYRGTPNANYSTRRENYFLLVSKFKDKNGNTINVPVYINERAQYNHVYIETNKIATVYGNDDFRNYINQQVQRKNLVRIKIKSNKSSEGDTPLLSAYRDTALDKDIIPEVKKSVKANFSYKAEHENGQKNNAENGVKHSVKSDLFEKINRDTSEEERAKILKNKKIQNIAFVRELSVEDTKRFQNALSWDDIDRVSGNEKRKLIQKIAKEFGVFKEYVNNDVSLSFRFSNNNYRESFGKQKKNFQSFAKMFSAFEQVIESAVGVEVHNRNAEGYKPDPTLKNAYVLISAFGDGDSIIPVKLEVKEFNDKENTLYVAVSLEAIKMTEVSKQGTTENGVAQNSRSVNISISDLLPKINPKEVDFLKYIPNELLTDEQIASKNKYINNDSMQKFKNDAPIQKFSVKTSPKNLSELKDERAGFAEEYRYFENGNLPQISAVAAFHSMYSTKQTSPIQAHYTEVLRENRNLKQIISLLDEMQYSSASGNVHLNSRDIDRIARELIKSASSKYDQKEFADKLTVIYDYMANSGKNADTEEIYKSLLTVANGILEQSEMKDTELYDQYKNVRDFLRNQPIYITPQVKKEIETQFGDYKSFRNILMGKVMHITTTDSSARTLDEVWPELAEMAPEYFPKDFNELDMPMQLAAFYEAIAPRVVNPYEHYEENMEDAAAVLATEIFQKFYEVGRLKSPQEKYRNLVFENMRKLENSKKALREEFRQKTAENEQRHFNNYKSRVAEYKQQREAGDRRRRLRNELDRNYNYLNRRIVKETDNDHIPKNLKDFVNAFRYIVPDSNSYFSRAKFTEFENEYRKLEDVSSFFDEDIARRISELKDRLTPGIGAPRMRDLDNFELEELRNISEHVKYIVQNENRLFSDRLKGKVENFARAVHNELAVKPESRAQGVPENNATWRDKARNNVNAFIKGLTKPEYLFGSLGSETLKSLYDELRRGENTEARILADARAAEQEIKRRCNYDQRWEKQKITINFRSGKMTMTVEQTMALYAASKRKQGLEHMLNGGVVLYTLKEEAKKNGKAKTNIKRERHVFNETDLPILDHALTDDQKNYVNAMVGYISQDIGRKRNEISLKLNGIEKYKEKFYFPIKVDRNFVDTSVGRQEVVSTIKNQSSAKRTVNHAHNPIEIAGFTETVNNHIYDSALYCAYVLPINDFKRVYNFRDTVFEGEGVESLIRRDLSVKEDIRRTNGVNAIKQIEDFMIALDSGSRYENLMPISAKLAARAKKVSVMANLSTVIQQPTAVFRAMLYVDPKHFATLASKADVSEMKKWNGCALKKEIGYFDVNMGRTATDYINEYSPDKQTKKDWNIKDRIQNGNIMLTIDQVAGWGATKADEMTWGAIWKACKKQTKTENAELTGDALNEAASELFQKVISKTQVYDSVFTKPDYMRRKEGFAMLATQFMSEPLTSLNMLADAVCEARNAKGITQQNEARKFCGRAFACYMTSLVVNSALKSLVYTMRDDDDENSFLEKYIANVTESLATEPFGMIPYVKDILSIVQGYDLNRTDVAVFASFKDAIDALASEKKGAYDKIMAVLKAAGQASGIPAYAVIRDGKALLDVFNKIVDGVQNGFEPTTGRGVLNELRETFDYLPFVDAQSNYDQLYNAIVDGDTRHYEKVYNNLIADGKEESTINSELASRLAENDGRVSATYDAMASGNATTAASKVAELKAAGFSDEVINKALNRYETSLEKAVEEDERIARAAQARYNMDYDEYERIIKEMVAEGYRENIVRNAADSAKIELETKAYEFAVGDKNMYTASYDLQNALVNGDSSDVKTVYEKLVETNGKFKANSSMISEIKKAYGDDMISKTTAEKYLKDYSDDETTDTDISRALYEAKSETNSIYDKLDASIDNGRSIEVDYLFEYGVEEDDIRQHITSKYKNKLLDMEKESSEYDELYESIIDAYVKAGYSEFKAIRKIKEWYD